MAVSQKQEQNLSEDPWSECLENASQCGFSSH